jgi:hypothetical protein
MPECLLYPQFPKSRLPCGLPATEPDPLDELDAVCERCDRERAAWLHERELLDRLWSAYEVRWPVKSWTPPDGPSARQVVERQDLEARGDALWKRRQAWLGEQLLAYGPDGCRLILSPAREAKAARMAKRNLALEHSD